MSYETNLNEVVEILFSYIEWYGNQTQGTFSPSVEAILIDQRQKVITYFEDVLDQQFYLTQDYIKFREFLIDWFSSFRTLMTQEKENSDIDIIDKDLLLKSLGYTLHDLHNDSSKKTLCTAISDLYSIKGSPLSIETIFTILGISNFIVFEYWLYQEGEPAELILKPHPIEDTSLTTSFDINSMLTKPLESVTDYDCHWYYTSDDIINLNETEPLGLPSLTPYVGVASVNDWVSMSRTVMSRTSRLVRDQFNTWKSEGVFPAKIYYFSTTDENLSLMELIAAISYSFNETYDRTELIGRDVTEDKIFQTQLNESIVEDDTLFINEFNEAFKIPQSRAERDQMINNIDEHWATLGEEITYTHSELASELMNMNPELKQIIDDFVIVGNGYNITLALLLVFDYFVRYELGIVNYTSIYMIKDPLFDEKDSVMQIFNFFKPWQARLVEFASYLVMNDLPGNVFLADENLYLIIKQTIEDIFDLEDGEYLYLKIYENIVDRIGFPSWAPGNRWLYDLLWFNIVMLQINQIVDEVYIDYMDVQLKINLQTVLTDAYSMMLEIPNIHIYQNIFDHIGYNQKSGTPLYDLTWFEQYMININYSTNDIYSYSDNITIQVNDL